MPDERKPIHLVVEVEKVENYKPTVPASRPMVYKPRRPFMYLRDLDPCPECGKPIRRNDELVVALPNEGGTVGTEASVFHAGHFPPGSGEWTPVMTGVLVMEPSTP